MPSCSCKGGQGAYGPFRCDDLVCSTSRLAPPLELGASSCGWFCCSPLLLPIPLGAPPRSRSHHLVLRTPVLGVGRTAWCLSRCRLEGHSMLGCRQGNLLHESNQRHTLLPNPRHRGVPQQGPRSRAPSRLVARSTNGGLPAWRPRLSFEHRHAQTNECLNKSVEDTTEPSKSLRSPIHRGRATKVPPTGEMKLHA